MKLKKGETFVAFGDSITDCGRRGIEAPLGNGYVRIFRDLLMGTCPDLDARIVNKGVGGNTVPDLRNRFDDDVLPWKPEWMSILVGINDVHQAVNDLANDGKGTPDAFEKEYRALLSRIKETLECRVILMEPFYLSTAPGDWRGLVLKQLEAYRAAVRGLSDEFDAIFIPLHEVFQRHLSYRQADTFCMEPVHPNATGHVIIARELYEAMRE